MDNPRLIQRPTHAYPADGSASATSMRVAKSAEAPATIRDYRPAIGLACRVANDDRTNLADLREAAVLGWQDRLVEVQPTDTGDEE